MVLSPAQAQAQTIDCDNQPTGTSQKDILTRFYCAANGGSWTNKTGWGSATLSTWHGVTVASGEVTRLILDSNNLTGTISTDLGSLTNLIQLALSSNQLTGTIPAELGSLTALTHLHLNNNKLTGTIPTQLGNLTALKQLRLWDNQLSGTIPTELGNLTSLTQLQLNNNQLTGTIPTQLGNLTALTSFSFSDNQLSGTIPTELTSLTNLPALYLGNNQLTGTIPAALGTMTRLTALNLAKNKLSGTIPTELTSLTNMKFLRLNENELTGEIPSALGTMTSLINLILNDNQLSGEIPPALGSLTALTHLDLHNNQLTGTIPAALGTMTALQYLRLYNNKLSGEIPATALTSLTNLLWLYLHSNELSGEIPAALGNMNRLQRLRLDDNKLTGTIPAQLSNLSSRLQWLLLNHNQLSGEIPTALGSMNRLSVLYLNNNQLTGPIPAAFSGLTGMYYLYLNHNQLSGEIPAELGGMTTLWRLYLHNNQLSGEVPAALASPTQLRQLTLSHNRSLTGALPAGLSSLGSLTLLDIRCTGISVPTDMAFQDWLSGIATFQRGCPPPPRPSLPPPVITSAQGVTYSEETEDGFPLTPLEEEGSITYRQGTINISITRDEGLPSDSNPAVIIPRNVLDRVREITFVLSEVSPQDPPSGFRLGGFVADIDLGITLRAGETVTVCLPPAEVQGESHIYRYDDESGEWERLEGLRLEPDVNGVEMVCGETDAFSPFGIFLPVIESAEGVLYGEETEDGFPLTPVGEGGSIVYGDRTIYFSVTGDIPSSRDPAVIVPRDILDRVNEITFALSEVSPHDPPPGLRLSGFAAEVNLGITLGAGETVSVCLPSAGGDIYRYSDELGEWEVLPSRVETVNGEDVVCGETGAVSLMGVFAEETGGCAVAAASGEGTVRWQGAVFNLLLAISVLLLIPGMSKLK